MNRSYLFLIGLCLTPTMVMAWGNKGHRIVAQVAYHYMAPEARQIVDSVLGRNGLVYWAAWPDEIRSDPSLYSNSYDWHYQDLDSGLDKAHIQRLIKRPPKKDGRLWTRLAQLEQHLSSSKVPEHDALVFYAHLMGDRLCPTHIAHAQDKGGNTVEMPWFERTTNLHNVWDEDLIESRGYSYTEYAQMLIDVYDNNADSLANKSDVDCIYDVYLIMQRIYEYHNQGDTNTYHYIWHWHETCDRLLFLAGVQLAHQLNFYLIHE